MTAAPDPHRALGSAIAARVTMARADIVHSSVRPWASVTFSGARHDYVLRINGPDAMHAARTLVDAIGQEEFDISGHLVADIFSDEPQVIDGQTLMSIEALTVEAR